jgi:hypothetical protein
MTEAYHTNSTGGVSRDDEGAAAALGIAKWLCLAATPTFAIMALMTGVLGGGPDGYALLDRAWVSTDRNGPDVYIVMSAFHLAPWLKPLSSR